MGRHKLTAVLSVTHDRILCDFDDICCFLRSLTGHEVWVQDIPRLCRAATPFILQQQPILKSISVDSITRENVWDEIARIEAEFGEYIELHSMPSGAIAELNPLQSLEFAGFDGEIVIFE